MLHLARSAGLQNCQTGKQRAHANIPLPVCHLIFFTAHRFTSLPLPQGRAGLVWKLAEQYILFPPAITNALPLATHNTPSTPPPSRFKVLTSSIHQSSTDSTSRYNITKLRSHFIFTMKALTQFFPPINYNKKVN